MTTNNWQPIETAPSTDFNHRVLLYCVSKSRSFGGGVIIEGYVEEHAGRKRWRIGYEYKLTPTHWQPLPRPPKEGE